MTTALNDFLPTDTDRRFAGEDDAAANRNGHQVGRPMRRVDGPAKVSGRAKYAAEFNARGLAYGHVVNATIAHGKILKIDAGAALQLPGVIQVITHENRPDLAWFNSSYADMDSVKGEHFRPLADDRVRFSMQPIALVVAETFELARYAASLVHVAYERGDHAVDLQANRGDAYDAPKAKSSFQLPPKPKGTGAESADEQIKAAAFSVDHEYVVPAEHHNPMESHATTVLYDGADGSLEVYDKTQSVLNSQTWVCNIFGLSKEKVRVRDPYTGGGFGSGLRPQYQLFMATLAATQLKRSVRVSLTRDQMFSFGHRPATIQRVALGCDADGKLQGMIHTAIAETSRFEEYAENVVNWSAMLYQTESWRLEHQLVKLDNYTPLDMRAPGAATGSFAIESAMDELAYEVGMDPIELRLANYTDEDPVADAPWSSKELRECYRHGAEKFGWSKRTAKPGMSDGNDLIGYGFATGVWEALQQPASAKARLSADGHLEVCSATGDIGTGTYTAMTLIAADALGLQVEKVSFTLGDSSMPQAPLHGGSMTVTSVGSAVLLACNHVRDELLKLAQKAGDSPLAGAKPDDVECADGALRLKSDASKSVTFADAMRAGGVAVVEKQGDASPKKERSNYSLATHQAVFAEVRVDKDLGSVRVTRLVHAVAAGRIINPKTARSQILGAGVWGIGMALEEETMADKNLGRFMNHNLAEYHVAVNKDTPFVDVIFVDETDDVASQLGAKGLGEIGICGTAAAIANAVYHATGTRVRELPITLDKVL